MAPTLTAAVDAVNYAVNLTVTGATGAITVTRYVIGADPTGQLVRGSFVNGRVVPDRDAPLNTDLTYIATDSTGQSPQMPARIDSSIAVLNVMSDPALSMTPVVLAERDTAYDGRSTAHEILGTNEVLATIEKPAMRRGTYEILLPTYDDWALLRSLMRTGAVMLMRSPCPTEFADTAFLMIDLRIDMPWNRTDPRHRIATVSFQATAPDTAAPRDYAWTYADIPAEFATYDAIPAAMPSYDDLAAHIPAAGALEAASPEGPGM